MMREGNRIPANTPEEVHQLFAKHFSAGDLEALLALYEFGTTLVPQSGPPVIGLAAIREVMNGFLALKPQFDLRLKKLFKRTIFLCYSRRGR